jgi:putative spermidine/putrescine transport system permease protein
VTGARRFPFVVAVAAVWTLLPLVPLLLWSWSGGWPWPALLPPRWSGRAWNYLLSPSTRALPALATSITLSGGVAALALVLGVPAALGLARYGGRSRAVAEAILFAPLVVPPLAVAVGLHVLFIRLGLADTMLGVMLVHLVFALPYVVLILLSASATLRGAWEEQGRSLGATPWQVWWHVTLPMLRPSLAVAATLAFLVSWSQYVLTLLIGGGQVWTLPLLVFATARGSDPALLAAAALLLVAPTLVVLLASARFLDHRQRGMAVV